MIILIQILNSMLVQQYMPNCDLSLYFRQRNVDGFSTFISHLYLFIQAYIHRERKHNDPNITLFKIVNSLYKPAV